MEKLIPFIFLPCLLFCQAPLSLQHLGVSDGLSQGQVNFTLKDSRGFLWLATQDGLNRFDGYNFKHFYHLDGDSTSLSNNYIWCLLEDSKEDIWVGTFGGELCRFDRETETFQSIKLKPFIQPNIAGNSVRTLCEYPEGTLWIGADKGLWSLNTSTLQMEKKDFYSPENSQEVAYDEELVNVVAICSMAVDRLLVGAAQGLFEVDMISGGMRLVKFGGENFPTATSIIPGAVEGSFWVGTQRGLYRVQHFPIEDSIAVEREVAFEKNAPSKFVHSLFWDAQNNLWIGTNEGLGRLYMGSYSHFPKTENGFNSLSEGLIYSILEVEPGLMIAGTREGVNFFSNKKPPFQNLTAATTGGLLCSDAIIGMVQDGEDNLWVGTRQGLTRIGHFSEGKNAWEMECITPDNTPSMPFDYVINIRQDGSGGLWACFRRNGFAKLKKSTSGKWFFEKTTDFDEVLNGAGMNEILFDNEGVTWLGTPGLGLIKWQMKTGRYEIFTSDSTARSLKHPYIFDLFEDSQERLWVATANGGLCQMDKRSGRFDCHVHDDLDARSISNNMVLSVFEDSQHRLWACTANGLDLWEGEGRFRRFYQKDGLPNDVVYGLLEDASGNLWASTNRGISKITFDGKTFKTQNFTSADGLPYDEFNQHSFLKTKAGQFIFGTTGGLTIFSPEDIQPYPYPPRVALTDFQLFNRSVPIGGKEDFVLEKAINETTEITLRHDQNFIAFEFAALGYTQPENNLYAYQLVGLDGDWVQSEGRRFASYPNLAPGDYTFRIKAANHDGIWNENLKSLKIKILQPWWATWWAYLFYALTAICAVFGIIRFRENSIRQLEQAKADERERFRKRTARDFHDEAGNRITKLALLTEVAKRRPDADKGLMAQMEENVQALRSGMRDFIWVLDPENDNLHDTLLRLKDFGNGLFEHSPIRFHAEGLDAGLRQIPLSGNERRHLLLIFKEAMNNAVKYSEATEAVLSINRQKGKTTLVFQDNGKGFDPASVSGNGLRNMRERAGKIGAGILIEAGDGVRVELKLG